MSNEAKAVVETAKTAIETADKALDLYNKTLDQMIPWATFEETVKELSRYQTEYSAKSAALVGNIHTLLLNSQDGYFKATQRIYEWCGLSSQLLRAYLTLFNQYDEKKAAAQKAILIKVLDSGLEQMTAAQKALGDCSTSFNEAAGKLDALGTQLANDFSEKSDFFAHQVDKLRKQAYGGAAAGVIGGPFGLIISYSIAGGVLEGKLIPELKKKLASVQTFFNNLQTRVKEAAKQIKDTKAQLEAEIVTIGKLKTQTETTRFFVDYDDLMLEMLKEAAGKLIAQCDAYQKSHGKKN